MREIIKKSLLELQSKKLNHYNTFGELDERYSDEDIMSAASKFTNFKDFKKEYKNLYNAAKRRGLKPDIISRYGYPENKNLVDRMVYMYIWNRPILIDSILYSKSVYFGLTCDEDSRFRQHNLRESKEEDILDKIEVSPKCITDGKKSGNNSAVKKFIKENGIYDEYHKITVDGYVKAEIAAEIEMCMIAYYKNNPELKEKIKVINQSDGGELGGRCSTSTRSLVDDVKFLIKKGITDISDFENRYKESFNYWDETSKKQKIFNKGYGARIFKNATWNIEELLKVSRNFNNKKDFLESNKRFVRYKTLNLEILFPENQVYKNIETDETYVTLNDAFNDLNNVNDNDFYDYYFQLIRHNGKYKDLILIPKESKIVEMVLKRMQIKENISQEKLAKSYLSKFKLEPWKNDKYEIIFLTTQKGTTIFLIVSDDYEICIQDSTYDMLMKLFKNEDTVAKFLFDYISEKGIKLPFSKDDVWISRSENVGQVEDDDVPYFNSGDLIEGKMLPKNKLAKFWLSRFNNLKKYKSPDNRFIYLATENGTILVSLDTQINETGVSWERIWSMLEKHFTTTETRRKIIGWLLDNYHLTNMGYVYDESEDMLGKIDDTDILIDKNSIQENESKNPVKNYWFKKWSRQKEKSEVPSLQDIEKLGFSKKRNEIIQYFSEFMGFNDDNSRSKAVEQYLLNHTFTEKQITEMNNFDQGKIKIKFTKVTFSENENQAKNYLDLVADFVVLSGSFYNPEKDEISNFAPYHEFDDFVEYFEFKETIEQIVESFVHETLEDFGFNINNHFDFIKVSW